VSSSAQSTSPCIVDAGVVIEFGDEQTVRSPVTHILNIDFAFIK
jgi:hypothetical protein